MSLVYDSYRPDLADNDVSGAIVLEQKLTQQIDEDIVTSDTMDTNFAIGGSKIYSHNYFLDDSKVWWHPEGSIPAGALRQAEIGLDNWLSGQGAQPTDEIAIIWSQGEADALSNTSSKNPLDREKYKQSTLAVFDYLRSNLDYADITFYIVPTGRFQDEAAINRGWSNQEIDLVNEGRVIVKEVQAEMAKERDDIQLASGYSDLNMVYEEGLIYSDSYDQHYDYWSQDVWHLGHDGLKINGDRLDISELLELSGYISTDPIRDGYITVVPLTEDSLEIQFDVDGMGSKSANTLAILENIDPLAFQEELVNQFIIMPTEFYIF